MYGPGLWCLGLVYDVTNTDCWALFIMLPIQITGPCLWCHRYILLGLVYDVTVQITGPGLCHQYRLLGTKWQHLHSCFFVISKHGFKKQDEKWSENQLRVYFFIPFLSIGPRKEVFSLDPLDGSLLFPGVIVLVTITETMITVLVCLILNK